MSAVYTVGTISVTNGSDIVTGSGTGWVGVIQTGWQIKLPNGEIYWVRQVNSATELQLENAYTGTSQSNQDYIAGPTGGIARALANKVQDLIGDFQSVVDNAGDGKFADGDLAQPGIRFIADEDTGFRRPSSNTLDVVTGGTQRARFSSSGMNLSGLLSGTAVTQSATDTTAGRIIKTGDAGFFRLGTAISIDSTSEMDLPFSLWRTTSSTAGVEDFTEFTGTSVNGLLHIPYRTDSAGTPFAMDLVFPVIGSKAGNLFKRFNDGGTYTDPVKIYDQANILGTVSQSSGVPTGAIIQRGSNANGEFVRFADGTQIMWTNIDVGDVTQNGSGTFGDPYRSNVVDWNFPAAHVLALDDMSLSINVTSSTNVPARMWVFGIGRLQTNSVTSVGAVRIGADTDDRNWRVTATVHTRWF